MTQTTCRTPSRVQPQTKKRSDLPRKTALVSLVITVGKKKKKYILLRFRQISGTFIKNWPDFPIEKKILNSATL